jgi:hypothetical protein
MHAQIQMLKRDTSRPPNLETIVRDDQDLHVHEPPDSFVFRVPENILQVWHCDNQLGFLLQFNINDKIDENKPKKPNSQYEQVVNIDNVPAKLPFFECHI